jgi:hypothetical protein
MIRHKSDTRWSDDQEVGWCCVWSTSHKCDLALKPLWWFLGLDLKTRVNNLMVWPQNHYYCLMIWASKSLRWFPGLCLKTKGRRFIGLCLKTDERIKMVWEHMSTFSGLLHRKASRARVSQFCLKIGEVATTDGARGIIVEVTLKWSERRSDRWHWVRHNISWTKLPLISRSFHFNPQGLSYPVLRKRERNLHTCAQDVQITRIVTIW